MKKLLAVLTALTLLLTLVPAAMGGFDDAPKSDHWVYENFMLVYNSGLLKGYPDGTFKGQRYATRYEAVELIGRVLTYFETKLAAIDVGGSDGLNASDVRALIREELAAQGSNDDLEAKVEELYRAIQELQNEYRDELEQQGIRITLLEGSVRANAEDIAALQADVEELQADDSSGEALKQAKSAKIMAIIGIILGIAGIAMGG